MKSPFLQLKYFCLILLFICNSLVLSAQSPTATPSSTTPSCGGTLELYANAADGINNTCTNCNFEWTGPNGFSATIENPILNNITSANEGTYNLTVTNQVGNMITASIMINEISATQTISTVMTPNGDNINDVFLVDCGASDSKLTILSQWGDVVYTSDNYQNDWRGTYNGGDLPVGTYFYIVEIGDTILKGYFMLHR